MWDMVNELASLELMFKMIIDDNLSHDAILEKMKEMGVDSSSIFEAHEIYPMTKKNIVNTRRNINVARDNLVEHMGGFFVPQQDECLYEWIRDGMGYSKGRRMEADNFTLNPASR